MNIGIHKRPRLETVLTTIYFAGVLISACILYMLQFNPSPQAVEISYRIIGVTFFTGIMTIYFTARAREERVVYLDKKNDTFVEEKSDADEKETQLDDLAIKEIIKSSNNVPQRVLNEICNKVGAGQGAIYTTNDGELKLKYGYALNSTITTSYRVGEGLVGRVAAEGKYLYLDELPEGYITVFSGLGNASPRRLALVPVKSESGVKGVIEIATFSDLNETTLKHLEECVGSIHLN